MPMPMPPRTLYLTDDPASLSDLTWAARDRVVVLVGNDLPVEADMLGAIDYFIFAAPLDAARHRLQIDRIHADCGLKFVVDGDSGKALAGRAPSDRLLRWGTEEPAAYFDALAGPAPMPLISPTESPCLFVFLAAAIARNENASRVVIQAAGVHISLASDPSRGDADERLLHALDAAPAHVRVSTAHPSNPFSQAGLFAYDDEAARPGAPSLGAIVIPATAKEYEDILAGLSLWTCPAFSPSRGPGGGEKTALIYVFNGARDDALTAGISKRFDELTPLHDHFLAPEFLFAELSGASDFYGSREKAGTVGATDGFKAGPNNLFFFTLQNTVGRGRFIAQMETDCLPARAGWLDLLRDLADRDRNSWVIGAQYRGFAPLRSGYRFHLNGNALYRVGDPAFGTFLEAVWRQRLLEAIPTSPALAYDTWWSTVVNRANSQFRNEEWSDVQSFNHRFRPSDHLINLANENDSGEEGEKRLRLLLGESPTVCLVHSRAVARRIFDRIRQGKTDTTIFDGFAKEKRLTGDEVAGADAGTRGETWVAGASGLDVVAGLAADRPVRTWRVERGVAHLEGPYVDRGIAHSFRWTVAKTIALSLKDGPAFGGLVVAVHNPRRPQSLRVRINGEEVASAKVGRHEGKRFECLRLTFPRAVTPPCALELETEVPPIAMPDGKELGVMIADIVPI